jgi:hypothetical protein
VWLLLLPLLLLLWGQGHCRLLHCCCCRLRAEHG